MSYAAANAVQKAVYTLLVENGEIYAQVGDAIFDAPPPGPVPELYLSIGTEQVTARGDVSATVARHRLTVSVISDGAGFASAKVLAESVSDALDGAKPLMERGCMIGIRFQRALARRIDRNKKRRIDLRFDALVDVPRL